MRVLAVLSILGCVQVVGELLIGKINRNNYILSDIYRIIEVSLLCAVFHNSVIGRRPRFLLKILGTMFAAIWALDMLFFVEPNRIDSGMAMIARSFLIVMSAVTLMAVAGETKTPNLDSQPILWVILGVVLYSSGTLVVLGLSNVLLKLGVEYFVVGWHLNWTMLIAANILYARAMLCKNQE
jgi:hypothetical protein